MRMYVTRLMLLVHKWIGIGIGVIVFVWLVSGMVMILPFTPIVPKVSIEQVDMRRAVLSPAAAIDLVATRERSAAALHRVLMIPIADDPYYKVDLKDGKSFLINAATGARLVITRDVAERLARRNFLDSSPVRGATQITEHRLGYPGGPLPAWRLEFDDAKRTVAYVSTGDGTVTHGNVRSRIRVFVSNLHTFEQIETLGGSTFSKKASLHLTSIITIVLVLTGYYVVLPRRWRRRWEARRPSAT